MVPLLPADLEATLNRRLSDFLSKRQSGGLWIGESRHLRVNPK
jgi:hypothetical protein